MIQFDPNWSNLIWSDLIWTDLNQFDPAGSYLTQIEPIWSDLNQISQVRQQNMTKFYKHKQDCLKNILFLLLSSTKLKVFSSRKSFKKRSQIFELRPRPWTIFSQYIVPALKNWEKLAFCYQNCFDLLWEKIVLVFEKKFWNSRLKAKNLQNFWGHLNNLFKQWKVRTISGNRMLFNFFLEVSHI